MKTVSKSKFAEPTAPTQRLLVYKNVVGFTKFIVLDMATIPEDVWM